MPRTKRKTTVVKSKKVSSGAVRTSRATGVKKQKETFLARQRESFLSIKWTESYSSFLLGVVVVILVVLFSITLLRQHHAPLQQTSSLQTGPVPTAAPSPTPGSTVVESGQTYYVVKENDSLWEIAVAYYHDGYQWVKIANANNLANPGSIYTGNRLLLPGIAVGATALGQLVGENKGQQAEPNAITGNTYTVQKDDSLWSIAVRAYADGYQWVKIANANNLANPDLIFSGNVLQIPR